jgi:3-oxoadipate enol-lactonase/4-carboxymuconolactone decarboxylase
VWQPVIDILSNQFHCVALSLPGHRESSVSARDGETIELLGADVVALATEQGWSDFIVAGVSIGGAVALEVALAHPPGLRGIAVCCASSRFATEQAWQERAETVQGAGTGALVDMATRRWFAEGFVAKEPESVGATMNDLLFADDSSYISLCGALAQWDRRLDVSGVSVPSVVISGELDPAATPAEGAAISELMSSSQFVTIPGVSHLAPLEAPNTVARLIAGLAKHDSSVDDPRIRGFRTRREVLGNEHVDRAQSGATPETAIFQDFITRYAWGEIWSRPQLDRRSRSIATLSALVALGNDHELAMHIRVARRHELSWDDIGEVFLHAAIYVGLPNANQAFTVLRQVVAEEQKSEDTSF